MIFSIRKKGEKEMKARDGCRKRSLPEYVLEWIYPHKCLICRDVIPIEREDKILCEKCRNKTPFLKPPFCKKCGVPITVENSLGLCSNCFGKSYGFTRGYAAFSYETMKETIEHFKFQCYPKDSVGLAKLMAEFMVLTFEEDFMSYDYLVPVPIHAEKMKTRGFNQAALLAEELCLLTGQKTEGEILLRIKNTKPQSQLSEEERKSNLEDAFAMGTGADVEDKRILLIDDIFTTGSTINECAKLLLRKGAREVSCYCLSIVDELKK